jgi:large subunit ribosomal protein L22
MAKRQREKSEMIEKTRDRRPTAIARYIRIPSDKVAIVLDLIRGRDYQTAAAILSNTNKSACAPVLKLLNSAAANAENNQNIAKDNLFVAECYAMAGPTLKRMMPRARGRADRILKRTSHIKIVLEERAAAPAKRKTRNEKQKTNTEDTKAETKSKSEVSVKTSSTQTKKTTAKEIPDTAGERPITNRPNAKKPLGTKSAAAHKSKAESTVKKQTSNKKAK